jgi:hypothetical protein
MKNSTHIIPSLPGASSSPLCSRAKAFLLLAAILPLLLSTASIGFAGSATWLASPPTGNWNHAANWSPATVPDGPSDTATFATSNKTGVSIPAKGTQVNGIVFNSGASAFTIITASPTFFLTISGVGITNNSGITQNFVTAVDGAGQGLIQFTNSATAGSLTAFTNTGGTASGATGGSMRFLDTSTAGNGTFTTNGGAVSGAFGGVTFFYGKSTAGNGIFTTNGGAVSGANGARLEFFYTSTAGSGTFTTHGGAVAGLSGGSTTFFETSTAGNGTFTTNGGAVSGAGGGQTRFFDTSTAGNGTFTTNGGAVSGAGGAFLTFFSKSTAGNGTFIANGAVSGAFGGEIHFTGKSHGGTSRVEVFGNGSLDISGHNAPGVRIGSIEGDGIVFLGANNLTVGSNKLKTTFSGVIQDGSNGTGGSLTKTGKGTLFLTHSNTYTGGTSIAGGKLVVSNKSGSGTGSGPVEVNVGKLGGNGTIAGAVTVGTGSGSGAILSPGRHWITTGNLTIQSTLTFNSDATYNCGLNTNNVTADKVVANGVTINSAQFSFADLGSGTLTPGTVFTVISNTAATPIAGTFSNLADGATFTNNGNSYKVNYQGGDGNDLTLKVVP